MKCNGTLLSVIIDSWAMHSDAKLFYWHAWCHFLPFDAVLAGSLVIIMLLKSKQTSRRKIRLGIMLWRFPTPADILVDF